MNNWFSTKERGGYLWLDSSRYQFSMKSLLSLNQLYEFTEGILPSCILQTSLDAKIRYIIDSMKIITTGCWRAVTEDLGVTINTIQKIHLEAKRNSMRCTHDIPIRWNWKVRNLVSLNTTISTSASKWRSLLTAAMYELSSRILYFSHQNDIKCRLVSGERFRKRTNDVGTKNFTHQRGPQNRHKAHDESNEHEI